MPIYGTSILSFIPNWTAEGGCYAIEKTAQYGFDMLEICLPDNLDFDAKNTQKQLDQFGIKGRLSLNIPADCHIPFYPEKALALISQAIDKVGEMKGDFLGGVLHSAIGTFTGQPCTSDEKLIIKQVFEELGNYASKQNITIAVEPINRYESYVITAAHELLELIDNLNTDNIGLHLDTFHMNIEERNFYDPIIAAGDKLKHVHITESDRGMTGEGNVHWDDFFKALSVINYQGPLVLENFSSEIKALVGPTSLWRPSKYNSEELAKGSLTFMKEMVAKWY
ncbi:sugar phosphate isomerase/epimerase family protein [Flavobacterium algicola]|uniref:sugar phosphate isomerase/epimerase family protein n=1 Tax=Flavobacterium algicola TaxID=556529 RepID=UPI001EFDB354|nr:sugar phosphate isomerase/epimerase family protein [Flavobacterium algicola]MCG9792828.1 sugar phosphate isomerase/epimerase [Flavobacterium algicola]